MESEFLKSKEPVYITIIMTPTPETIQELDNFLIAAAEHHTHEPDCISWIVTRAMDPVKLMHGASEEDAMQADVVLNQEWTSLEAWIEHGKTDWSVNARAELVPLLNWLVIMKAGRKFTGFTRKWTWDELVE